MFYSLFVKNHPYLALLVSLLFSLVFTIIGLKPVQRLLLELKIGQPIRFMDAPILEKLHENKKNTPTMGGALLIAIFFIFGLLFLDFSQISSYLILIAYGLTGLLGAYDDFKKLTGKSALGLSSKKKFFLQILIGLTLILVTLLFAPDHFQDYFGRDRIPLLMSVGFFIFIFVGSSNAVNLTDGLDGLASGVVAIVSLGLLIASFGLENLQNRFNELFCYSMILGTSIGFLWMNQFPAKIFMGDTGSLSYGALLALNSFLLKKEWLFAWMGIVFVVEALSVIIQVLSYRLRNKKRVFLCTPIHHHFQYLGMNEVQIVTRFWIISIIFVLTGLIVSLGSIA